MTGARTGRPVVGEGALRSDALLLIAAVVWGFAFVAQRVAAEVVGPFTFNGVRFALGALALVPVMLARGRPRPDASRHLLLGGALCGTALFLGVSLQQMGIMVTTAGKAGFITGLYVVIVPILGLLWGHRPGLGAWSGALCAAIGLFLLSMTSRLTLSPGDSLVLGGAFVWAIHVLLIGWFTTAADAIRLAFLQFVVCSASSLVVALMTERIVPQAILAAAIPTLYAGVLSVGLAYTLQVVAQRHAPPAHAAIILSLEAVFAALGGWIILGERLSLRGGLGCTLMLGGVFLSQLTKRQHASRRQEERP